MAPEKAGPVWPRKDFIAAWKQCADIDDWDTFFGIMNEARKKAGCDPYKADTGLSIQIGKTRKSLMDAGYAAPSDIKRPRAAAKAKPTIKEDAEDLKLRKLTPEEMAEHAKAMAAKAAKK